MEAQFGTLIPISFRKNKKRSRFVTRNYVYGTGSMTGIIGLLKWESLKIRKGERIIDTNESKENIHKKEVWPYRGFGY